MLYACVITECKPLNECLGVHVDSPSPPAGIKEPPLPLHPHSIPHVVRRLICQPVPRPVPNTFAVSTHLLTLNADFPTEPREKISTARTTLQVNSKYLCRMVHCYNCEACGNEMSDMYDNASHKWARVFTE